MNIKKRLCRQWQFITLLSLAFPITLFAEPLQIGILPFVSMRTLLTNYQPLWEYLSRELNRPIEIFSAPDYSIFYRDTKKGNFDLLITAPHLGRLAQLESKYQPLLISKPRIKIVFLVHKKSPLTSIQEIKGKTLTIGSRLAFSPIVGLNWLSQQGLQVGRDFTILQTPTHHSAAYSVINGEAAMALTSNVAYGQFSPELKKQLRVLETTIEFPSQIFLAGPNMKQKDLQLLKKTLLRFAQGTPEAEQFIKSTGFEGFAEIKKEDLNKLDVLLSETRDLLRQKP